VIPRRPAVSVGRRLAPHLASSRLRTCSHSGPLSRTFMPHATVVVITFLRGWARGRLAARSLRGVESSGDHMTLLLANVPRAVGQVNAVAPCLVDTPWTRELGHGPRVFVKARRRCKRVCDVGDFAPRDPRSGHGEVRDGRSSAVDGCLHLSLSSSTGYGGAAAGDASGPITRSTPRPRPPRTDLRRPPSSPAPLEHHVVSRSHSRSSQPHASAIALDLSRCDGGRCAIHTYRRAREPRVPIRTSLRHRS